MILKDDYIVFFLRSYRKQYLSPYIEKYINSEINSFFLFNKKIIINALVFKLNHHFINKTK
jgi:hypothetical protein